MLHPSTLNLNVFTVIYKKIIILISFTELRFEKLTVGKIYGGLLILENWRTTRFGQIQPTGGLVSICMW